MTRAPLASLRRNLAIALGNATDAETRTALDDVAGRRPSVARVSRRARGDGPGAAATRRLRGRAPTYTRRAVKLLLAAALAVCAGASVFAASDWALYRASIAAADGALRLHEASSAATWLEAAPSAHRGWEWRYLRGLADESLATTAAHAGPVTGLAVSPDGRFVATTSADKTVKVWEVGSRAPRATLTGHTAATWSPAFRPGHPHLATMGSDGSVRVWDHQAGTELAKFDTRGRGLGAVAWSPDGALVAAATWTAEAGAGIEGWVALYRFESRELLWRVRYGVKPITTLAFRPDGRQLAVGTWDAWVGLFAIPGDGAVSADAKLAPVDGSYPVIQHLVYAPDGVTLAAAAKDGITRVFRSADATLARQVGGHTRWVNAVAFGGAGTWMATASSDETIRLWDAASLRPTRVLHGHTTSVTAIAITPDASRIVSGAADGTLRWWDGALADATRTTWGTAAESSVYGLDFSRDGTRAATASWGGAVSLWDVTSGRRLWTTAAHERSANAVAFSPDGRRLVSGGNDGRLQILDTADGRVVATWEAIADGRVAGLAWSPDGRWVFAPSSRPGGKLWDAATGKPVRTIAGSGGEILRRGVQSRRGLARPGVDERRPQARASGVGRGDRRRRRASRRRQRRRVLARRDRARVGRRRSRDPPVEPARSHAAARADRPCGTGLWRRLHAGRDPPRLGVDGPDGARVGGRDR